jgi:isopentenyl-diphosphate delta-isomerase type 2
MSFETPVPASRGSDKKEKHLAICTDPSRFQVEGGAPGFAGVRFLHDALPEIAAEDLDTGVSFLGGRVPMPFFISCMTGGSEGGFRANRTLAAAAQELGVPVGLGSIRVLLSDPDLLPHFHVKPLAPDVPVLANIGAVQVRDGDRAVLLKTVERLEAQALVVHLNPGQELFQEDGDRDFRGLKESLRRLIDGSPVPVIVKETGFGIGPGLARELIAAGAAYVDIAGAGGTNWISVESYRLAGEAEAAKEFADWGMPTGLLLAALGGRQPRLLASGGIRTGMDAAKCLALGAELAGLALPAIRAAVDGGQEAVVALYRRLQRTLRAVMIMTGSRTVADLRNGTTWLQPAFAAEADALRRAWDIHDARNRKGGGKAPPRARARAGEGADV